MQGGTKERGPLRHTTGNDVSRYCFAEAAGRCRNGNLRVLFTPMVLVLLFSYLLPIALARQRFFYAFLLTWLQVERMAFDFLDDVFRLNFSLEATQGVLKGFPLLNSNLCQ